MQTKTQVDNAALALRNTERQRIELALPAHLMFLMIEEAAKKGFECRADILDLLNNAQIIPFIGLDDLSVARVAKKTDDAARSVLHDLSPDDASIALITIAHLVLKLVDEHLFPDPKNQGVLVALLLTEDAKEFNAVGYDLGYHKRSQDVGMMLTKLRLLGYYQLIDQKVPQQLLNAG